MRDLMTHKVDVQERTLTQDVYKGEVEAWTSLGRHLRCRIRALKTDERIRLSREGVETTHRMVWQKKKSREVVLTSTNRVVWGSLTLLVLGMPVESEEGEYWSVDLLQET